MAALYQDNNNNQSYMNNNNEQFVPGHKHHKEMSIHLPPLEKQKIGYILDNNSSSNENTKLPSSFLILDNNYHQFIPCDGPTSKNIQRLPSPATSSVSDDELIMMEREQQPTENEIQYIKRIHALMRLVARQTDEIQSLRAIIASHHSNSNNNNKNKEDYDDDNYPSTDNKRIRMQY